MKNKTNFNTIIFYYFMLVRHIFNMVVVLHGILSQEHELSYHIIDIDNKHDTHPTVSA